MKIRAYEAAAAHIPEEEIRSFISTNPSAPEEDGDYDNPSTSA